MLKSNVQNNEIVTTFVNAFGEVYPPFSLIFSLPTRTN